MSLKVNFNYVGSKNLAPFQEYEERVGNIDRMINEGSGQGSDYLGWLTWPTDYDKDEVTRMLKKAMEFQQNYETLVVCGIGGSYLGARACIEALTGSFNANSKMEVLFFGNTLDPNYSFDLLEYIKDKKFCVCVISKSGTTTETSVSFRILKEMLENKYGKKYAKNAIVAITDKEHGALRKLADIEGYETYNLPANIGGRFSVITPVGLFPIACAGIDINALLAGCRDAQNLYNNPSIYENPAYQYAVERNYLYVNGYKVEMLCSYEPRLKMLNEWWKQLFDESEGKASKAVLTSSCTFTTDLHSLGQFIQDGSKILYETTIYIDHPTSDVEVPFDKDNLDELNYLAGKKLSYINEKAYIGTLKAHSENGGVPNITISLDTLNARTLGHLLYFFMKACAMSAYLLGVNPFNQPGVEIYKKNMFHLLGKKGY